MKRDQRRWTKLAGLWCNLMHNEVSWPIHGHYHCRTCHRTYSAPWN